MIIKNLHIEPTTTCNLRCPQCARYSGDSINSHMISGMLTLPMFINAIADYTIESAFACGNFGEPIACNSLLSIFSFLKDSFNTDLNLNTNGSLRNAEYFASLASILSGERDYCVFSIDGLSDTNGIYRRDSSWKKIMENASSFIDHGGVAVWDYLVFSHNEHQIQDAICLAYDMGFKKIRFKKTARKVHSDHVHFLKKIDGDYSIRDNPPEQVDCSFKKGNMFMNSRGELHPCCFLPMAREVEQDHGLRNISNESVIEMIDKEKPHIVCRRSCGIVEDKTVVNSQVIEEIILR